jgi:16S rRNA (cytidine1402-2'-O)-methyltransferase
MRDSGDEEGEGGEEDGPSRKSIVVETSNDTERPPLAHGFYNILASRMTAADQDGKRSPGGRLSVIATPLGNPADLSPRARERLDQADVILAEDTRSARRLLMAAGLEAGTRTIVSCFDANEGDRADEAVAWVAAGRSVALISEAGTPLVSDPGFRVVAAVAAAGLRVEPVPGPSAILAALVGSGLSPDRFAFLGFPPRKRGARRRLLESVRGLPFTLVFYESPLRTGETLADLADVLGPERQACVARELTKTHEELVRDTLAALATRYRDDRPLGEVTLVVAGADLAAAAAGWSDDEIREEAAALLAEGASARDAADRLAPLSGRPRREVYGLVTALASERQS